MFLEQTSYLFVGSYFQALIVVMQMIYDVLSSTSLWPIYHPFTTPWPWVFSMADGNSHSMAGGSGWLPSGKHTKSY
jgi:hypothetical protein